MSNVHRQTNDVSDLLVVQHQEKQEHTMNLIDLLVVELHTDHLRMFNETREETLKSLGH